MLTTDMLSDLCCPNCGTVPLRAEVQKQDGDRIVQGKLICEVSDEIFGIEHGIPNLIPNCVVTGQEWIIWQDHLEGLQERRNSRQSRPDEYLHRMKRNSQPTHKSGFAKFIGVPVGKVLDVGCGPGRFREYLGNPHVQYYGLDPIALPETNDFPFVRALSECIPFKDNTFSHVVIVSALDHFNDVEAFLNEAVRVLRPNGMLYILQGIHDVKGPVSAVKMLTHWVKDSLETRATKVKNADAPKHITEFNFSSLRDTLSKHFEIVSAETCNYKWYSATKLFLALRPLAN